MSYGRYSYGKIAYGRRVVAAASGNTATISWTEANDIFAVTASISNIATISWVEGSETFSANAVITNAASAAWIEGNEVVAVTMQNPAAAGNIAAIAWIEANDTFLANASIRNNAGVAWIEQDENIAITMFNSSAQPERNMGFEMVSMKPWIERLKEVNAKKYIPAVSKNKIRKARRVEFDAAQLAITELASDEKFQLLMQKWNKIYDNVGETPTISTELLFMAQIALRIREIEQDDEDAILALLLA